MSSVEVTGKTLADATAEAARMLHVAEDALEVEVIEEPRGILGLLSGGNEFRIRATVSVESDTTDDTTPGAVDEAPAPEPGAPDAPEDAEGGPEDAEEPVDDAGAQTIDDTVAREAETALNDILSLMGVDAAAAIRSVESGEVSLDVSGSDSGSLIGRHGATLDALQLIVAIIANRGLPHGARVVVDAEGYRERRRQMLEKTALAHAAEAKETGKEIVITELKPYERRIVHMTLKDDEEVETYSEGEGDERHLVISPHA